jgi:hypothetical protein
VAWRDGQAEERKPSFPLQEVTVADAAGFYGYDHVIIAHDRTVRPAGVRERPVPTILDERHALR